MSTDPITIWIQQLAREGGSQAAERLWETYYSRLVELARRKIGPGKRRVTDEEDVVLSAFDSFVRRAAAGKFPRLEGREDLWKLLVRITARKAFDHQSRERRQKRGGGQVRGDSAFRGPDEDDGRGGIDQVIGREPTPDFAAQVVEEYARLLGKLETEELRNLARMRLENYSVAEIAAALDSSVRTVRRRLAIVRERWEGELER
jgi:DNA-directed RNA polymerase specialized sigma24 family protein